MSLKYHDMGIRIPKLTDEDRERFFREAKSMEVPRDYVGLTDSDGDGRSEHGKLRKVYEICKSALEHCTYSGCTREEMEAEVERLRRLVEQGEET